MSPPGLPVGVWWAELDAGSSITVTAVLGGHHPDGTTHVVDDVHPSWTVVVSAQRDRAGRVRRIELGPGVLPGGPALWYVGLPEPAAEPPAMTLVAFESDRAPTGAVLDEDEFRALGAAAEEQVGAVRWWIGSGLVHQVYVAPAQRRRKVAMTVLHAAAGYRAAMGWAPLRADGQRTELGDALAAQRGQGWGHRVDDLTQVLPPMTPPDRTEGVPERNLRPDRS